MVSMGRSFRGMRNSLRSINRLFYWNGLRNASRQIFTKILIANRGEISCRIMRTASRMNIKSVGIFSDEDRNALHVSMADEAYRVGEAEASKSYLRYNQIIDIALKSGAEAVHPGYGFLSENAEFAEACKESNIVFIGPPSSAIRSMGSKSKARSIMQEAGVPITPGYDGADQSTECFLSEAKNIGFPILIKAVSGGGGKGDNFIESLESCRRESFNSFGDSRLLLEKYITGSRHIEVQIFADSFGNTVHLFERDCSVQRRHQKVLEEAPASHLPREIREELGIAAVRAAEAVNYVGAGTVEFLVESSTQKFYFCEMNTRLQVEHPVTEMITGLDLVEWQLRVASGEELPIKNQADISMKGHAIEARIYAENTDKGFLPCFGTLNRFRITQPSTFVRIESGIREGDRVSMYYDPMIAKIISWGENRAVSLNNLAAALRNAQILGTPTNIEFCERVLRNSLFRKGGVTTSFLQENGKSLSESPLPSPQYIVRLGVVAHILRQSCSSQSNATCSSETSQTKVASSPFSGTWRMVGHCTRTFFVLNEDETEEEIVVALRNDGSYRIGSAEVTGCYFDGDNIEAVIDGTKIKLSVYISNPVQDRETSIVLWDPNRIGGKICYRLNVANRRQRQSLSDAGQLSNALKSPMPGKVVRVLVERNDEVLTGQALVIVEAMKMEHSVFAVNNGVVGAVYVREGDMVNEDMVLVEMKNTSIS